MVNCGDLCHFVCGFCSLMFPMSTPAATQGMGDLCCLKENHQYGLSINSFAPFFSNATLPFPCSWMIQQQKGKRSGRKIILSFSTAALLGQPELEAGQKL